MRQIIVDLAIPADEYLALYRGDARTVHATSREGLSIRFPANILQRYVTRTGIYGSFAIYFDDNNKFQSISRLA